MIGVALLYSCRSVYKQIWSRVKRVCDELLECSKCVIGMVLGDPSLFVMNT